MVQWDLFGYYLIFTNFNLEIEKRFRNAYDRKMQNMVGKVTLRSSDDKKMIKIRNNSVIHLRNRTPLTFFVTKNHYFIVL